MGFLRKVGQIASGVLRRVGQIGGKILSGIGNVKQVADQTGLTGALTGMLASNPMTAPIAAGVSLANPIIGAGKSLTNSMAKIGG